MPQPSGIYPVIILCVRLKDMAKRRVFSPGQRQGHDWEKESGESFAAGSACLGEAADDSRE